MAGFGNAGVRRIITEAKSRPCADCGGTFPHYVMDLDHRGEDPKLFNVSDALSGNGKMPRSAITLEMLAAEIAKCDAICANCHRERTQRRKAKTSDQTPN